MSGLINVLRVESDGLRNLKLALSLAMDHKVTHYRKGMDPTGNEWLDLLWHGSGEAIAFPYPLTEVDVHNIVEGWLRTAKRGAQDGGDGSYNPGFLVEAGHPLDFTSVCKITAIWNYYSK
jgi:hypothetical protein